MNVVYVGPLPPGSGHGGVTSWLLIQQMLRMGVRVRAIAPVTPATAGEAEVLRRAHPEMPRLHYSIPEFCADPAKRRPEDVQTAEQHQIEALLERLLQEEPVDLIIAGREVEARAVPAAAERHGVPWLLRCGGYTLHLLQQGMLAPTLHKAVAASIRRAAATIVQARHVGSVADAYGCKAVHVVPN